MEIHLDEVKCNDTLPPVQGEPVRNSISAHRRSIDFIEMPKDDSYPCCRRLIHFIKKLFCCCRQRHENIAGIIVKPRASTFTSATVIKRDRQGNTPLHLAKNAVIAQEILNFRFKGYLDPVNNAGVTPVFSALQRAATYDKEGENPHLEVALLLIHRGANLILSRELSTGYSFFHLAIQFPEVIGTLIQLGKDDNINSADKEGRTAVGLALVLSQTLPKDSELIAKYLESAKMLINWKTCLDHPIGIEGYNVLHYIVDKRIERIFPLDKGRTDLNGMCELGMTPLCYALQLLYLSKESDRATKEAWQQKPELMRKRSVFEVASKEYLKFANYLFEANAKIEFTEKKILPHLRDNFVGFIIEKGFTCALVAD